MPKSQNKEEHSMDQCRSRLKLSEDFERYWSIRISGDIHMDQSLVHTFSWGNSYGPIGPESSSRVSPYTSIGPWMAPPSKIGNAAIFQIAVKSQRFEIAERPAKLQLNRLLIFKNLLMPLFSMGCFPEDFGEGKRPTKAPGETANLGQKTGH